MITIGSETSSFVSIIANGSPTFIISPSSQSFLTNTPSCVDGISESTLSVAISKTHSSSSTWSPWFFSQVVTVASATLSPIFGNNSSILAIKHA